MHLFTTSLCPECLSDTTVWIIDNGSKLWWRFLSNNNRFACKRCKITWRKKNPADYTDLSRTSKRTAKEKTAS